MLMTVMSMGILNNDVLHDGLWKAEGATNWRPILLGQSCVVLAVQEVLAANQGWPLARLKLATLATRHSFQALEFN